MQADFTSDNEYREHVREYNDQSWERSNVIKKFLIQESSLWYGPNEEDEYIVEIKVIDLHLINESQRRKLLPKC